jgi:hypothetical protein
MKQASAFPLETADLYLHATPFVAGVSSRQGDSVGGTWGRRTRWFALMLGMSLICVLPAQAGLPVAQDVHFKKGASSTRIEGSITGSEARDYVLSARRGQTLSVTLTGAGSTYFNVLPTGNPEAIHIGSINGSSYAGPLPADGSYTVRVYQMGNAKTTGKTRKFVLDIAITGAPAS